MGLKKPKVIVEENLPQTSSLKEDIAEYEEATHEQDSDFFLIKRKPNNVRSTTTKIRVNKWLSKTESTFSLASVDDKLLAQKPFYDSLNSFRTVQLEEDKMNENKTKLSFGSKE